MKYKLIIWDFNGTIIDDMMLGIESVNKMLHARGLRTVKSKDEYRQNFRFPVEDYYRELGFDFSVEPYEKLAHEWFDLYMAGMESVMLIPHVKETIKTFEAAGIEQVILSASEKKLLTFQLDRFGLTKYFSKIIGNENIYAYGKAESAKKILAESAIGAAYIGDTMHDFECAKEIGADIFLFSGGHGSKDELLKTGCLVFDSMKDICAKILE